MDRLASLAARLSTATRNACWLRGGWSPILGFTESAIAGATVQKLDDLKPEDRRGLSVGDRLVGIGATTFSASGQDGLNATGRARREAVANLLNKGERFNEVFEKSSKERLALDSPIRWRCGATVFVNDNADRAGLRNSLWLSISASRLSILSDDELLAFLLWNQNFVDMRYESNADAWMGVSLFFGPRPILYEYNAKTLAKIDWLTLEGLHRLGADLGTYSRMLKKVDFFDKEAPFSLIGSKKFIDPEHGGSPKWTEEKQTRLDRWIAALNGADPETAKRDLEFPNPLLVSFLADDPVVPLTAHMTIEEALRPLIGSQAAAEVSAKYLLNYQPAVANAGQQPGGSAHFESFQMIYVHHPSKELVIHARSRPSVALSERCAAAKACTLLVVRQLVVAKPGPKWQAEIDERPGGYTVLSDVN